ncbi:AraC family transcriptional regulator [Roseococcus sp. YIM B11640]|uniref:helix-turn-helix transcriptional regulator n=1 Tax=Roseococcus sp. YIM B11640 TaxID=3133973 RepID=UPI003C7BB4F1
MVFALGTAKLHAATVAATGYAMDWHAHDCAMLMLPRRGALQVQLDGSGRPEHRLMPGEALVVAAGVGHRSRAEDGAHRHLALYAPATELEGWLRGRAWHAAPVPPRLLALLAYRDGLPDTEARAGLADSLILAETAAALPPPLARDHGSVLARAVAAHLAADPAGPHELDALAARFGISRRHLTRLFQRHEGESIGTRMARLRVEAAASLIAAGHGVMPAAHQVGLASPSHLARLFRRHMGQAPRMARSRSR